MSFEKKAVTIDFSPTFLKRFKILSKRYLSLAYDLEGLVDSLKENPMQGADLGHGLRKVRMAIASKGKGKSGGARVITYTVFLLTEGRLRLLTLYDKSDRDNLSDKELMDLIEPND